MGTAVSREKRDVLTLEGQQCPPRATERSIPAGALVTRFRVVRGAVAWVVSVRRSPPHPPCPREPAPGVRASRNRPGTFAPATRSKPELPIRYPQSCTRNGPVQALGQSHFAPRMAQDVWRFTSRSAPTPGVAAEDDGTRRSGDVSGGPAKAWIAPRPAVAPRPRPGGKK